MFDLPLRQSSSHGRSTLDLMTIQLQGRLCCLLAIELHCQVCIHTAAVSSLHEWLS